ncbi:MAG TPA: hypothetical protein VF525_19060 [Pyrinomonadaceae bacterium]|jgi:hypothetical protein
MWRKKLLAEADKNRFALTVVLVGLNILLTTFLIYSEAFSHTSGTLQSTKVSIAYQQDAPLVITLSNIDDSNPSAAQVNYVLQNISNKSIRAYAVLEESITSRGRGTGSTIVNLTSNAEGLQSSQIRSGTYESGASLLSLKLSIDYVEFVDGTTWGNDTQHTAENLAGQRTGSQETVKRLRELFNQQGQDALVQLVKRKDAEVATPPVDRSAVWQYGFQVGHNSVLHRLRIAYEKGGPQKLTSELLKPVVSTEGSK